MPMCITVYVTDLSFVLSDWGKLQNKETFNMATDKFLIQVHFLYEFRTCQNKLNIIVICDKNTKQIKHYCQL